MCMLRVASHTTPSNSWKPAGCNWEWSQLWPYLPRDSIPLHRLRAQSHQTTLPHHFRHQLQVQVVTCTSDQVAVNQRFPQTLLFRGRNLLEWSQNWETFHLLAHWFSLKEYNSGTARWKKNKEKDMRKEQGVPCPLPECHSPSTSIHSRAQKLYSLFCFYEGFIAKAWSIQSLAIVADT